MTADLLRRNRSVSSRRLPAHGGGFSLVELVLVLTITAVMAAIALPRYSSALARYRVRTAARRVVADLALAPSSGRGRAAQPSPSPLMWPPAATRSPNCPRLTIAPARTKFKLGRSPYQVTVRSAVFGGDSSIIFNGYGLPDSAGTVVVALGSYSAQVEVDATTGRARVP